MTFLEKIRDRWICANTMVCVGLDSDEDLVPASVAWRRDPVFQFNKAIIDRTCAYVCAYKLNIAFYSGAKWLQREVELIDTIRYIQKTYPKIPVILDAKRGDIGNTAKMYAKEVFDKYGADAVTVNPYLGQKGALEPFLERADKGVIILCRTSNEGAREFQDLLVFSEKFDQKLGVWIRETPVPLYQKIAYQVANHWNKNGNSLLVVGATYPKELGIVRQIVGDMPILVPGIGAQKGDIEAIIRNGLDSAGHGLIINASRSIIYASKERDFADAAAKEAKKLRDEINQIRAVFWRRK